jgi:ribosomal protein S18 acetylase RimI-like enzyme
MATTASQEISVRHADLDSPADAAAVLDLLDAYAADPLGSNQRLSAESRGHPIPALRDVPGRLVLLAFDEGAAVGLAVCFRGFSTFQVRPLLNVHDRAVLASHRGRGIGTALLNAVEREALRRGCCKVTLEVRSDNQAARTLYGKSGFGAARVEGQEVQYLFLEKRLRS